MPGPPCTSFSTMQDLTQVIRTRLEPYGVQGLSERLQKKIDDANVLASFSLDVFAILMKLGLPVLLENPRASRLWYFKEVEELLAQGAELITADLCPFGTQRRERTSFLVANVDESVRKRLRRPCGGCDGLCGHTQKPHILPKGKKPGTSVNWTSLGQVYPPHLCDTLAGALIRCHRDCPQTAFCTFRHGPCRRDICCRRVYIYSFAAALDGCDTFPGTLVLQACRVSKTGTLVLQAPAPEEAADAKRRWQQF